MTALAVPLPRRNPRQTLRHLPLRRNDSPRRNDREVEADADADAGIAI